MSSIKTNTGIMAGNAHASGNHAGEGEANERHAKELASAGSRGARSGEAGMTPSVSHRGHVFANLRATGRRIAAGAAALVMGLSLAACGNASSGASDAQGGDGAIDVVVSVNQWQSIARDLGGDKVDVTSILANANVEAHDFEPQPNDIAKFSKAEVVVVNGADYDHWATDAAQGSSATVVSAADGIDAKEGDNPHLWFSAKARSAAAGAIEQAYEKARPADAAYFKQRYQEWHAKETKLAAAMEAAKAKVNGDSYAATESVAKYLADDLGLKDATPEGYANAAANEAEPAPADIKEYVETLEAGKVRLLFVNDQEANDTTQQLIDAAGKGGVPIVHLTESMPDGQADVESWMTSIIGQVDAAAAQTK